MFKDLSLFSPRDFITQKQNINSSLLNYRIVRVIPWTPCVRNNEHLDLDLNFRGILLRRCETVSPNYIFRLIQIILTNRQIEISNCHDLFVVYQRFRLNQTFFLFPTGVSTRFSFSKLLLKYPAQRQIIS